jgi:hypothetical protein
MQDPLQQSINNNEALILDLQWNVSKIILSTCELASA